MENEEQFEKTLDNYTTYCQDMAYKWFQDKIQEGNILFPEIHDVVKIQILTTESVKVILSSIPPLMEHLLEDRDNNPSDENFQDYFEMQMTLVNFLQGYLAKVKEKIEFIGIEESEDKNVVN